MRIFFAGATGAIGRVLLPRLLAAGHSVTAMTRSKERATELRSKGAEPVVCDALDPVSMTAAIRQSRPEAVLHQLTALPKRIDPRHVDEALAETNRLRIEATRNLAASVAEVGARRFIVQSIAFAYAPGGGLKNEDDPLYRDAPKSFRRMIEAVGRLETTAQEVGGVVLRYGYFYGPATYYAPDGAAAEDVRRRRFPILGDGDGVFSFVHLDDAAEATMAALDRGEPGVYNIVDDEPAPVREWLPFYAEQLGAKRPYRVPRWLGRLGGGPYAVYLLCDQRGASNAKAKRELGWSPRLRSWREGFRAMLR